MKSLNILASVIKDDQIATLLASLGEYGLSETFRSKLPDRFTIKNGKGETAKQVLTQYFKELITWLQ